MNCSHGLKLSGSRINTLWTFAWRASTIISCCFWNCQRCSNCLHRSMFTQRSTFKLVQRHAGLCWWHDGAGERETRYIYRWHLATIVTEVIIKINMHIYIIIIHQCVYEFCIHIYIDIFHGIFHNIWDNPSHWLICFKMVETTNHS